ncbi:hypothetical protein GGTG_00197 [Gaeumannomyces tritici R3-111a-1]|uniref:Uncharacterized protein n=1 Tax=Gaeumannomyces tritici (strain R3-111a-1) TaxID=644352 RepID=J3NG04_GAET3|nr:hypothetical protein GGTG_00197 [Gaeumannomyces tritici R3-111a-1]EJT80194.1 hypothetical protein GGTG_00197 [Gaeumannomyces tritici R3-111a-1]
MRTATLSFLIAPLLLLGSEVALAAPPPAQTHQGGRRGALLAPRPRAHVAVSGPAVHVGDRAADVVGILASDLRLLCANSRQRCDEQLLTLTWVPQRPAASGGGGGDGLALKELKVWYSGAWTEFSIFSGLVELIGQTFNATAFGGAAGNSNCWVQSYRADDGSAAETEMCETGQYLHAQYDADPDVEAQRAREGKRPSNYLRVGLGYSQGALGRSGEVGCDWKGAQGGALDGGIESFKKILRTAGISRPNRVESECCQERDRCIKMPLPL